MFSYFIIPILSFNLDVDSIKNIDLDATKDIYLSYNCNIVKTTTITKQDVQFDIKYVDIKEISYYMVFTMDNIKQHNGTVFEMTKPIGFNISMVTGNILNEDKLFDEIKSVNKNKNMIQVVYDQISENRTTLINYLSQLEEYSCVKKRKTKEIKDYILDQIVPNLTFGILFDKIKNKNTYCWTFLVFTDQNDELIKTPLMFINYSDPNNIMCRHWKVEEDTEKPVEEVGDAEEPKKSVYVRDNYYAVACVCLYIIFIIGYLIYFKNNSDIMSLKYLGED